MPETSERPLLLLVEDHVDTRQLYAEFLRTSFEVCEAADGLQALDAMRRQVPALVITDFSLPGIDGFELVKRMRSDQATREVPVICLSGYTGKSYEQRARAIGCDRILEKPCLPERLVETALELIARGRSLN